MKTLLIMVCLAPSAYALESGANFLKIDASARAVSMGAAYTALAEGVDSIAYNPAGLASARGVELGFSHTNWLMESRHDFISVAVPMGSKESNEKREEHRGITLGFGLTRLSNSDIEVRNADRSLGGSFKSYDQSVLLGMAGMMGKYRLGIGAKYIESVIAGEKARAVAADFGFSRRMNRLPISLGISVQNVGTPMKYISQKDPLPLTLAGGIAVPIVPGLNLAADVKRFVYDKQNKVSFGMEYAVLSGFALRSGYMLNSAVKHEASGIKNGFSAGAGINFWNTMLDYSVTPYGELGDTQKLSLKKKILSSFLHIYI